MCLAGDQPIRNQRICGIEPLITDGSVMDTSWVSLWVGAVYILCITVVCHRCYGWYVSPTFLQCRANVCDVGTTLGKGWASIRRHLHVPYVLVDINLQIYLRICDIFWVVVHMSGSCVRRKYQCRHSPTAIHKLSLPAHSQTAILKW